MKKITILGAGSWGASLAYLLSHHPDYDVMIWVKRSERLEHIHQTGRFPHPRELVEYTPERYQLTDDLVHSVEGAEVIVTALPSEVIASVIQDLKGIEGFAEGSPIILSVAKGLDPETKLTMSQIWLEAFPEFRVVALSGPNLSAEVATDKPMKTVIAGNNSQATLKVSELFAHTPQFKISILEDLIGLELCGAIKNVIALSAGVWDGLELGTSGKGCLLTKSIKEICEFTILCGGKVDTVYSVAGLGDLFITCSSDLSRNYRTGYYLAQGHDLEQISELLGGQVAEGLNTAHLINQLSQERGYTFTVSALVEKILSTGLNTPELREEYKRAFWEVI